jgi:hypothetical protein
MDLLKESLKDIGVASAGHRLRTSNAIAKLMPKSDVDANVSSRRIGGVNP